MADRAVFVTGAGSGIGRATALAFARRGWGVGGYDVDADALERLGAEITALGAQTLTGVLDVRDPDGFAAAIAAFTDRFGRLDVLVNNAGILEGGAFEDVPLAASLREVDVNVGGVVVGTHAAFDALRRTPGATVVNLCSASAIYGQPELATYSATKFAVRGLTEALDLEWRRHDIRVIALWPLFVDTAMTTSLDTGTTRSLGVRLTVDDVADTLVRATVAPSLLARLTHQVHFAVGRQARLMLASSRFGPAWAVRLVNKQLSGT
ncbi:SDR family oxidoreductase [Rhodococcus rhodnii]|uniref:Short-chain dehydrogenase n=2 Tax=Rhodococcus rhodnii TaxID=38312 RepID=R7WHZ9_9NOCA|nr:SDR family oxidoreductase [Rhodococcus rhodnii]EOM74747.1 short-chain dehydrogenase [Rhodococcus rhodnii LMG 5362]TXG89846.1 SDR family oxidoreductase [Rhodococcus rhodnii]